MAVSVAPSALASTLTDEQLAKLHLMILSPVFAKSFGLFYDVVREATSFTEHDLKQFRDLAEKVEAYEALRKPEARRALEAGWRDLIEKWRAVFVGSISPDTRTGLEQAIAKLEAFIAENRKEKKPHHGPPLDERQL